MESRRQVETITLLVARGADPNAANLDGATPLHRAVRTRCSAAVQALLRLGADPMQPNKAGSFALDLAFTNSGRAGSGHPEAKAEQVRIQEILKPYRQA